ncbi:MULTISPECIES: hypothetical protein [Bradyrhizobium]|uniref:hypothetical protein n=1 Tax=Bradyrhizobium TaxID=374 RepID=UPI0013744164|nr:MULTISPECIES: hypothetical protein [Bradyrhizobium]QHP71716.1 hypothetical protein EI171_33195 [Bradyrhizobium sp. LCT2]WLA68150.1 hypothetical protein QNN01_16685 [Bradyrhizobium diazoefficiens]
MNFRLGFFRIWVILSILFIIAVAILSYKDVSGEFEKASLDFSFVGIAMVPVNCKEARARPGRITNRQIARGMHIATQQIAGTKCRHFDGCSPNIRTWSMM